MTREEAIAYWKQRSEHIHNWLEENEDVDFMGEYVEAIDMAIEALKNDLVRCKDCRWRKGICCEHEDAMVNICDDSFCSHGERQET